MSGYPSPAPVVVVGTVNRDYVITVDTVAEPGETVFASTMDRHPGGRGARQAVAAARALGSGVVFVGCVGDDADGALLLQELRAEGIDTSEIEIVGWAATGVAIVQVTAGGQNAITVVPGANVEIPPARVRSALKRRCGKASAVVIQSEVGAEVMAAAVQAASAAGARPVLHLAPRPELDPELLSCGDPLVVNEREATAMLGRSVSGPARALDAARELQRVARSAVVTVRGHGACWADVDGDGHVPTARGQRAVDNSGAEDALIGVMATRLADGAPLASAVEDGVHAAALVVGSVGAQSSVPVAVKAGVDAPAPADRPRA